MKNNYGFRKFLFRNLVHNWRMERNPINLSREVEGVIFFGKSIRQSLGICIRKISEINQVKIMQELNLFIVNDLEWKMYKLMRVERSTHNSNNGCFKKNLLGE